MRRNIVLMALVPWTLAAQQGARRITETAVDINGRRVIESEHVELKGAGASSRTEVLRSINGRTVPLEQVEERVLREDASGRTVERTVRRFDQNGNPGPPERVQVEERRNPDGSSTTQTLIYRSDINGRMQLSERISEEKRKSGDTTTAQTSVERPSLNGGLEVAEKRTQVLRESPNQATEDVVTYRKGVSGGFVEAVRQVSETRVENGRRVENASQYEPGVTGRMELKSQRVSRSEKKPDGGETREVDVFRSETPGRVDAGTQPRLIERQIIEVRTGAGGSVVETVGVQRPTLADPNRLGPYQKLVERICTGACK